MQHVKVDDWMTRDPRTCTPDASVATARARMERDDVNSLLVVDVDGNLHGVVTWTDVLTAWPSPFDDLEPAEVRELMARVGVAEIMSRDIASVEPDATISEAVNLMFERKISLLPVLEGGRVVGILTNADLRQGLVRVLSERAGGVD
jgi:CBS domain-containing protein